jgi:ethanolamine utilization protein EutP (predicted NTPase)
LVTKIDLVSQDVLKEKIEILKQVNNTVLPVSIYNQNSLEKLKKILR